jgi:hypothetical protein
MSRVPWGLREKLPPLKGSSLVYGYTTRSPSKILTTFPNSAARASREKITLLVILDSYLLGAGTGSLINDSVSCPHNNDDNFSHYLLMETYWYRYFSPKVQLFIGHMSAQTGVVGESTIQITLFYWKPSFLCRASVR